MICQAWLAAWRVMTLVGLCSSGMSIVLERSSSAWPEEGTMEERWEVMRSS